MLSYRPGKSDPAAAWLYAKGFEVALTRDLAVISEIMMRYVWSPCVWKQGDRRETNFVAADYCVLDFDDPDTPLEQAVKNVFCDMAHVIGTTKSHQKEKHGVVCDRYRVLIPFTRMITQLGEYKATMRQVVTQYGSDQACKDGARYLFPCTRIVSIQPEGERQEITAAETVVQPTAYHHYGQRVPSWIMDLLKHGVKAGESRNEACYRVAAGLAACGMDDVEEICKLITRSKIPNEFATPGEIHGAVSRGTARGKKERQEAERQRRR